MENHTKKRNIKNQLRNKLNKNYNNIDKWVEHKSFIEIIQLNNKYKYYNKKYNNQNKDQRKNELNVKLIKKNLKLR